MILLSNMQILLQLLLAHNNITHILPDLFISQSYLIELDLSNNDIIYINTDSFRGLVSLKILKIHKNPIILLHENAFNGLFSLKTLNLSNLKLSDIRSSAFVNMTNLDTLLLSNNNLTLFSDGTFLHLDSLVHLDIRDNLLMIIPINLFNDIVNLETLLTSDAQICCYVHKNVRCAKPNTELSSCHDLLGHDAVRIFVWFFCCLGAMLNGSAIIYHSKLCRSSLNTHLKTYLCLADSLLSVYLAIIGIVDYEYKSIYFTQSKAWKSSYLCITLGFLVICSVQLSAVIVLVITIQRVFIVLKPLRASESEHSLKIFLIILSVVSLGFSTMMIKIMKSNTGACLFISIKVENNHYKV